MISDFYEEPQEVLDAVGLIRFRGNDVILFHVLDPAEIDFTFDDASSFEDLGERRADAVVPDALREQYRAMIQEHIAALTTQGGGAARRLHAAEHVDAARLRVVQLHVDSRSADATGSFESTCRFSHHCSSLAWPRWPFPC